MEDHRCPPPQQASELANQQISQSGTPPISDVREIQRMRGMRLIRKIRKIRRTQDSVKFCGICDFCESLQPPRDAPVILSVLRRTAPATAPHQSVSASQSAS